MRTVIRLIVPAVSIIHAVSSTAVDAVTSTPSPDSIDEVTRQVGITEELDNLADEFGRIELKSSEQDQKSANTTTQSDSIDEPEPEDKANSDGSSGIEGNEVSQLGDIIDSIKEPNATSQGDNELAFSDGMPSLSLVDPIGVPGEERDTSTDGIELGTTSLSSDANEISAEQITTTTAPAELEHTPDLIV
jgi:hypothetical protein